MLSFPTTPDDFYAARDHRTNLYAGLLVHGGKSVRVTADLNAVETPSGQVLFLASCNLLSRWCRVVFIEIPSVQLQPCLGLGAGPLIEFALAQMRDADPFGRFEHASTPVARADFRLHIGENCSDRNGTTTLVSARGWYAAIGPASEDGLRFDASRNCIGALFGAAIASARIFRDAIGMPGFLSSRIIFDSFLLREITHDNLAGIPFPDGVDLGRLLMVGAGSVASAAAYCIRLLGLSCSLMIVDQDIVKVENFARSPVFGKRFFAWSKGRCLSEFLKPKIAADFQESWWSQYAQTSGEMLTGFDIWLPLANEYGVRSEMVHHVPPLMIHASTNQNWGVNFGRHIPGKDECLLERFARFELGPRLRCATGEIADSSGSKADAAVPFLSFFAGALVAADLARLQFNDYPQIGNFAELNFIGNELHFFLANRAPRPSCVCQSSAQASLFRKLRAGRRYGRLAT